MGMTQKRMWDANIIGVMISKSIILIRLMIITGGIGDVWHVPPLLECVISLVLPQFNGHLVAATPNLLQMSN